MVERAGEAAKLCFKAHLHMLHSRPWLPTRSLQAYLRHKNIQRTVRYTELSPDPFKDFWR